MMMMMMQASKIEIAFFHPPRDPFDTQSNRIAFMMRHFGFFFELRTKPIVRNHICSQLVTKMVYHDPSM